MIYQNILNGLCDIYNLPRIKVVFNKDYLTNPNAGGQYNFITNEIIIDENEQCIMEILFHESRHYWQYRKYAKIFIWWTCRSMGLFHKLYWTKFCSIEEDARIFGNTLGESSRKDLLGLYSTEQLCYLRDNQTALRYAIDYVENFL